MRRTGQKFFKRRLMRKERQMVSRVGVWFTVSPYSVIFKMLSPGPFGSVSIEVPMLTLKKKKSFRSSIIIPVIKKKRAIC